LEPGFLQLLQALVVSLSEGFSISKAITRLVQEKIMKSVLNNACISALLCGAVIIATPALAQLGGAAGGSSGVAPGSIGSGVNATGSMSTPSTGPASTGMNSAASNSQANASAATGNVGVETANNGGVTPTPGTTGVSGSSNTTASTGGMSTSGDINTSTASNNAGSVNGQTQTPSGQMAAKSQSNASAAAHR
jgi:hypothetical protein